MIHDIGPNDVNGAHTSIWSYDYGCYIQVPSEIYALSKGKSKGKRQGRETIYSANSVLDVWR